MEYIEKSFSWIIINENHFIKYVDKSFFEFKTTGIPKNIKKHFNIEDLKHGETKTIIVSFKDEEYKATISIDPLNRAKLNWNSDLDAAIKSDYPSLRNDLLIHFIKLSSNHYSITFESESYSGEYAFKDEQDWYEDGRKIRITTTQHERNKKNREAAIRIHGTRCMICGFDFEKTYGEAGKGFIEVHHLKPLSDQQSSQPINPKTDLICVCSNCHSIIHRKENGIYTPEQIKAMLMP